MARSQGTSPRAQRLIGLASIVLLAAATAAAFGRAFAGRRPTMQLLAAAVLSALVASLLERRSLLLATFTSGALLLVLVGLMLFRDTTWHGLPSLDTLRAMRDASGLVGEQARVQVAPTPPLPPLLLAAITAIWAAVFSTHALALRAGSPLLALLPPVALLAFADTVLEQEFRPQFGVLFLVGALAVVFLDGLRRVQRWGPVWAWPSAGRRLAATTTRGARKVAMATLAAAAVAPFIVPGIGSKAVFDLNGNPRNERIAIDPLVSIKAQLDRDEPVDLLRITADTAAYWRMLSLDSFDGTSWRPVFTDSPSPVIPGTYFEAPAAELLQQHVEVLHDMELTGLPASYQPVVVEQAPGDLLYDPNLQTLFPEEDDRAVDEGETFDVASNVLQPTPSELDAVTFPVVASGEPFVALPSSPEIQKVRQIALDWTQGYPTTYQKILAIQERLRNPNEFVYDQTVPAHDDSYSILDFLEVSKRGFCQQFSATMAVMLRSLGIPARVAVGFTPGRIEGDSFVVTTDNAHSWVEVRFPTYGWLGFEPTQGRDNPVAFSYYDPRTVGCELGLVDNCGPNGPGGSPGQAPNGASRQQLGDERPEGGRGCIRGCGELGEIVTPDRVRVPWGIVGLVAGVLLLTIVLAVPPIRAGRRRRRLHRASRDPRRMILATYGVFTERAGDLGLPRGPSETIEEYRRRLASSGLLTDGRLEQLTAIAARAAYSPGEPGPTDARAAADAAERTLRDLRKGTGLARRLTGAYGMGGRRG